VYPTVIPTLVPTTEPTWNITLRRRLLSDDANVYDLDLVFSVQVQNKKESDTLWNVVKAVTFFDNYKNALKESLTLEWVTENYASDLIVVFEQDIESMAVDETQDGGNVDILSPTYSPTSHPTYDYEEGETYGQWMVGIGFVLAVAFFAYWSYSKYKRYKYEKKEKRVDKDKEGNGVEFQALREYS